VRPHQRTQGHEPDPPDDRQIEERGFAAFLETVEALEARHARGEDLDEIDLAFMRRGRSAITFYMIGADIADGKMSDAETVYSSEHDRSRHHARTAVVRRRYQRDDGTWREPTHGTAAIPRSPRGARRRGAGRPAARRATSTSSQDPGSDSDEPEPPASGRRCKACGADISHRRIDAKTCDGTRCRKAKSRGKVAPPPSPVIRIDRPLEDEIAAKAWQRHLAWAPDIRPGVRDDLRRDLEDLYAEKRRRWARQPLPAFEGKIASYNVDSRAAQAWRRPRRRRAGAVTTKQLEAVAA
jgi:hypothetical protein